MRRSVVGWIAAGVVFAGSASAWAQDYTQTTATGLLESRPGGATALAVTSTSGGTASTGVTLPFEFPYYGKACTTAAISAFGWIVPGTTTGFTNPGLIYQPHGQSPIAGSFPYGAGGGSGNADGVVAVAWGPYFYVNDGTPGQGLVYTWTNGTAPTRRFVVSWENVSVGASSNSRVTVQAKLFETTGRIEFAFSSHNEDDFGNIAGANLISGLDSPIDSRWIGNGVVYTPAASDLVFSPRTLTFTGTLLYDRIVSDEMGIGNSPATNSPLSRTGVELRRNSDGWVYAAATTAADGTFSISGVALPWEMGSIVAVSRNPACNVSTSVGGTPTTWTLNGSLVYTTSAAVGTFTLAAAGDPSGDTRSAFHVARACMSAYDWVRPRTSATIPRLDVATSASVTAVATKYWSAAPPNAAWLDVAPRSGSNPDVWDDAMITKAYARHVLASIAAASTTTYDGRFDAVTDKENAFAEGFGYFLWAAVSGSSQAIDGISASSATVLDLENPTLAARAGQDVAGCVAAALYDLLDAANETPDTVDGTSTSERVLVVADLLTTAPRCDTFLQAWVGAGYDGPAITRVYIGHGLLADDAAEPNDSPDEAPSLGNAGVLRKSLVLNPLNEDWFSVALPAGAASFMVDAKYDRLTTGAIVGVEIRTASGTLLTSASSLGASDTVHAQILAPSAATYRVGVRHLSGGTVPVYSVQAYVPPTMDPVPVRDWTVGRPYDQPVGARDGVAPYTVSASSGALPPGLVFDSPTVRVFGTPSVVGAYPVTVRLVDAGSPANAVSGTHTVTIHDVLRVAVAPFVGFALGKTVDALLPTTGGTPPFTLGVTSGALPGGLAIDPTSLRVTGTATAAPSTTLELDGVDVAGSADHVATRAVVAVPSSGKNVPADLVAGTDACGWWFDAVQGSKVSFTAATAKKRAKRTLVGAVLAPDRSLVLTGKIKAKLGSLTGSGIVCPLSGRYYVIASSDMGDATQLLGNVKVAPPKSGKAKPVAFAPSDTTTIEVGAVPGAVLTLKFAGEKKTTLVAKIVGVTDPTGAPVGTAQFVKATATGGTLTMTLPTGGTWTIVLGATSTSGVPGKLSYSYTLKQPKGVTYSAD